MSRFAVVFPLREGTHEQARGLLRAGPPFDPAETTLERHSVYLTRCEAIFFFEGTDAEWEIDDLTSDFLHPRVTEALEVWKPLLDGQPRRAEEAFFWERPRSGEAHHSGDSP